MSSTFGFDDPLVSNYHNPLGRIFALPPHAINPRRKLDRRMFFMNDRCECRFDLQEQFVHRFPQRHATAFPNLMTMPRKFAMRQCAMPQTFDIDRQLRNFLNENVAVTKQHDRFLDVADEAEN